MAAKDQYLVIHGDPARAFVKASYLYIQGQKTRRDPFTLFAVTEVELRNSLPWPSSLDFQFKSKT